MSVDHDPNVQEDELDSPLTPVEAESSPAGASESGAAAKPARSINIEKRAVIIGAAVVLALFITAYILTFVLERGAYLRDAEGSIIPGTYTADPSLDGIKWWQFILAPVMILSPTSDGYMTVWAIIILLFIIGAVFTALDATGIMVYMVEFLNAKLGHRKYLLLFLMSFSFMFLGSTAGMFEELIPLVPVVVMLCYALGWDALVGLAISVIASCFGFSAGVVNPFTVGVAQTIGGLELYSGIGLRILTFVLAYIILMAFLYPYARKIERYPERLPVFKEDSIRKSDFNFRLTDFKEDKGKNKALLWFGVWMLVVVAFALTSIAWKALADYLMYIILAIYVIAGVGASLMCGLKGKALLKELGYGAVRLLPAVILILIAGGIRYIVEEGDIMDTILYKFITLIGDKGGFGTTILIYLIIFVFEIFIQSGSAKALLLMPMIFDLCSLVGIHPQVAVLAFAFADGFSNVILPTNAGLLLILGLTTVDYGTWFKWSIKIHLVLFAATLGVLAIAEYLVYA